MHNLAATICNLEQKINLKSWCFPSWQRITILFVYILNFFLQMMLKNVFLSEVYAQNCRKDEKKASRIVFSNWEKWRNGWKKDIKKWNFIVLWPLITALFEIPRQKFSHICHFLNQSYNFAEHMNPLGATWKKFS
jgi:hypothetical protein